MINGNDKGLKVTVYFESNMIYKHFYVSYNIKLIFPDIKYYYINIHNFFIHIIRLKKDNLLKKKKQINMQNQHHLPKYRNSNQSSPETQTQKSHGNF